MRAHFAGEVVSCTSENMLDVNRIYSESESLKTRIDDFKRDPENMEALTELIQDVMQEAEAEAKKQQQTQRKPGIKICKGLQQAKEKCRQSKYRQVNT